MFKCSFCVIVRDEDTTDTRQEPTKWMVLFRIDTDTTVSMMSEHKDGPKDVQSSLGAQPYWQRCCSWRGNEETHNQERTKRCIILLSARRWLRSFVLSQWSTHVQQRSVTLKRVDATHNSAVLLCDCSCGTAKKATSDRTETLREWRRCYRRGTCHLFLLLKSAHKYSSWYAVQTEDRVLCTFARHLLWLPLQSFLSLQAS